MKLLFVADGRSPIGLNWIRYFLDRGDEIHLASTFPADPLPGLTSFHVVPVAFSSAAGSPDSAGGLLLRRIFTPRLRTLVRQWLGVGTLRKSAGRLADVIAAIEPDLIHAMRIPYESMTAALALRQPAVLSMRNIPPLLVSIWGNDFTLHARANTGMDRLTRFTMQQSAAIHADCRRDVRLAYSYDFPADRPAVVLPGAGGIQTDLFFPADTPPDEQDGLAIIQPRGLRAYVRNEAFLAAIPRVLAAHPKTRFICPAMAGDPAITGLVADRGLEESVTLLPRVPRAEMARLFRDAAIILSPTTHDGTPNTLLEALACGCFPVAGDLESIREWITPGENGLLVDPSSSDSIAAGLIEAIENKGLREQARMANVAMVRERAEYGAVMAAAADFYLALTK